ncbi:unnamed protein product [Ranitomeya imitator]|uniref:Uncharacterized protein n=1 Tax=Ranitomeya imitator TaxID=111125 RepID=A0ABN9LIT4_9NEOB|nr:unnamed protein product [Ranitomeya imitator]
MTSLPGARFQEISGSSAGTRKKRGVPFPKNFLQICKKILCRLFRVFVHVYIHHFDRILLMGAEAHVNTCYKHFYYFVTELNLIDRKELEPLLYAQSTKANVTCTRNKIINNHIPHLSDEKKSPLSRDTSSSTTSSWQVALLHDAIIQPAIQQRH